MRNAQIHTVSSVMVTIKEIIHKNSHKSILGAIMRYGFYIVIEKFWTFEINFYSVNTSGCHNTVLQLLANLFSG